VGGRVARVQAAGLGAAEGLPTGPAVEGGEEGTARLAAGDVRPR
jgi:hypothetical protein